MASTKERAWLAAHQKGSKALVAKLDKAHAKNPEYQAFKQKHGLGDTSSVKQVSKSQVDRVKEKARQTLAGKAYGATKGTRMGSAEGTGETLRDTVAPLTRDQHSAVKAAEREAKAAEKPAKPVKAPKPKKEKAAAPAPEKKKPTALELIAAAAAKRKINAPPVSSKALRRIAAVGDMEHDHGGFEDLGDTQYGGRRSYSEEVKLDEGDKHSFIGKIKRRNELRNKVQSTWKQLGDAQRAGNSSAASKAFRNHERYANLDNPGTWTKVKEEAELDESHKVGDLVSYFHKGLGDHLYGKVQTVGDDHITMKSAGKTWKVPLQSVHKADETKVPKYRYESVEHVEESADHSPNTAGWHTQKSRKYRNLAADAHDDGSSDDADHYTKKAVGHYAKAIKLGHNMKDDHAEIQKWYNSHKNVNEGMLDDYIEGKIKNHHDKKHNPEINAAHAAAAEVTKKIKPFDKKIAQIKKRVSYKDKTHKNYAKTRADLKDATAAIQPLSAERSKHYDTIRDARNKRDSNTDSDIETYHKWGVVGLGAKKLKQKLTKEEVEQIDEMDKSQPSSSRGAEGLATGSPATQVSTKKATSAALVTLNQAYAKGRFGRAPRGSKTLKDMSDIKLANKLTKEEVEQIDEASDLHCPSCGTNHGKDRENPKDKTCSSCGHKFKNIHGYSNETDNDSEAAAWLKRFNAKNPVKESTGWMLKADPKLAKKVKDKIELAKKRQKQMGVKEPIKEAKHYHGGALFADTAARLQKAINAHKERMDQATNGPEHEYHHPTLDIKTKSRLKLPAPWVKVEDK